MQNNDSGSEKPDRSQPRRDDLILTVRIDDNSIKVKAEVVLSPYHNMEAANQIVQRLADEFRQHVDVAIPPANPYVWREDLLPLSGGLEQAANG
ncbi:hypothetical protein [Fibrella aquatilis]|uniref:Uncharacterized protein n=1 Tax=Fibrella aquatilis TaxID=2817059 RepID=A0A939G4L7_9BACT|nr:hypothetical protein [Fibrella aquatilis]MBO0930330.1 hypothetical protein [Fibrella aquatilis]